MPEEIKGYNVKGEFLKLTREERIKVRKFLGKHPFGDEDNGVREKNLKQWLGVDNLAIVLGHIGSHESLWEELKNRVLNPSAEKVETLKVPKAQVGSKIGSATSVVKRRGRPKST